MKFTLRLTLILGFLTLCAGFPAVVRASDSSRSQKDSLRQVVSRTDGPDKIGAYKELARLYRMESRKEGVLDTLLTIYDALAAEAQQTGDVAEQSAAGYNRLIALYDNWLFDEIIRQALAILAFQSENGLWKNYYQTYTMLLDAYRRKRDFDRRSKRPTGFTTMPKGAAIGPAWASRCTPWRGSTPTSGVSRRPRRACGRASK